MCAYAGLVLLLCRVWGVVKIVKCLGWGHIKYCTIIEFMYELISPHSSGYNLSLTRI
jgi:hypothetical protein